MAKQPIKFSDQIRQAVIDSEFSMYRISIDTGLDESALGKFVRGERGFSLESINILAAYLDLRVVTGGKLKKEGR